MRGRFVRRNPANFLISVSVKQTIIYAQGTNGTNLTRGPIPDLTSSQSQHYQHDPCLVSCLASHVRKILRHKPGIEHGVRLKEYNGIGVRKMGTTESSLIGFDVSSHSCPQNHSIPLHRDLAQVGYAHALRATTQR